MLSLYVISDSNKRVLQTTSKTQYLLIAQWRHMASVHLVTIGSDEDMPLVQRQTITWTNVD